MGITLVDQLKERHFRRIKKARQTKPWGMGGHWGMGMEALGYIGGGNNKFVNKFWRKSDKS